MNAHKRDIKSANTGKSSQTGGSTGDFAAAIESNPLAVLAGGLALGAVAGALLPRSAKERELLAPVGSKLGETARAAIGAARDAGQSQLDELGLNRDHAKQQVKTLFDGVMQAATAAGTAALDSTKAHASTDQ